MKRAWIIISDSNAGIIVEHRYDCSIKGRTKLACSVMPIYKNNIFTPGSIFVDVAELQLFAKAFTTLVERSFL